jgi:hypothetical protein
VPSKASAKAPYNTMSHVALLQELNKADKQDHHTRAHIKPFILDDFVYGKTVGSSQVLQIGIDPSNKSLIVNSQDQSLSDEPVVTPIQIAKVSNIQRGIRPSPFVTLVLSRSSINENTMHLRFPTHSDVCGFVDGLRGMVPTLKITDKEA